MLLCDPGYTVLLCINYRMVMMFCKAIPQSVAFFFLADKAQPLMVNKALVANRHAQAFGKKAFGGDPER